MIKNGCVSFNRISDKKTNMAEKKSDTTSTKMIQDIMLAFGRYPSSSFDDIDKEQKHQLITVARAIAEEEVVIANEFAADPKGGDIRKRLGKYLSDNRLKLIEEGFNQQTYQIHITKKMDVYYADFIRDGKSIFSQKKLNNRNAIESTCYIQMVSIVVEAVLIVLQFVEIRLPVSEQVITRAAEEIFPVIKGSSTLQKAIKASQEAAEGGSKWDIAVAIFNLIKDLYSTGTFWQIIKSLDTNMNLKPWTSCIITAMIIASLATDGIALIAKIVLALNSASEFINKLTNLTQLEAIQNEVCAVETTPNWHRKNKSRL